MTGNPDVDFENIEESGAFYDHSCSHSGLHWFKKEMVAEVILEIPYRFKFLK